jgi:uncharacterized iron-regulated protein
MKSLTSLKRLLLGCALPLALVSCAHIGNPHARHPLIGTVWDVAAQRFVEPEAVIERAAAARFVLIGEIHDNADHHRIQARILGDVVRTGRRPALVMEQFDVDQQEKLNSVLRNGEPLEQKMRGLADLMRKTWDWPYYEPMVSFGLQQKMPLIAANLSRDALRNVARNGYDALGAGEAERLAIEAVWSPEKQKQLVYEVTLGHCGKVQDHMLQAIAKSQRVRDAVMADMMLMSKKNGAIAIFGRGHVRQDMGVPLYLAARAPDASVLSVGLIEVNAPVDPVAYAYGPLGAQHDYLWFTARPARKSDPCDSIPAPPKAAT